MVAAVVATYLQAVNISLPNAAVLHVQGALSMSDDEIGWVFSSCIAASAVVMPMTRWLGGAFGQLSVALGGNSTGAFARRVALRDGQ